ncbi:proteinase-activated receptor 3 [Diretmus argenteus]
MGKLLLFFLLCFVLPDDSLQGKGKGRRNISKVAFPGPRTFKGEPEVIQIKTFSLLNGTQVPFSPLPCAHDDPPTLRIQSNSTAEYLRGRLSTQVIPAIYILVVAVGIPANAAILCALVTKIRKVSSAILYCSLALSDLLLLLSLIFKAHYHLHGNHWGLGETACRAVTACFYGNLYCSALTLACISVKRYLAVVHPFLYKSLPKRTCSAWASLVVWGVFVAAVVPELLVQQSYCLPQLDLITCHDVLPLDHSSHIHLLYYNLGLTIMGLLLPLGVTAVCYTRIVRELNRSHQDWALYIKASSLVFVIFLLCFAPAGVLHMLHYVRLFVDGKESFYVYFNVAVCLCCLHSCLDPFLFLFMSTSAGSRLNFRTFKGKILTLST